MSLSTVLSSIGKDLKTFAGWLDDGLKIAAAPVEAAFPALSPFVVALEALLEKIDPQSQTPELVQALSTALAAIPVNSLSTVVGALEKAITAKAATPASS